MSRFPASILRSAAGAARAVLLTAGLVASVSSAVWAESPAPVHGVAIINGQHVQPSPDGHLPPPVARNPASIGNTTAGQRDELDRIAAELVRQTTRQGSRPVSETVDLDPSTPVRETNGHTNAPC
jgi:hypothetical protein